MTTRQQPAMRVVVHRDAVIDTAIALLYEQGFKGVTMRAVAYRLGVSPIPLYSKVGDKSALIEAVAERLLGEIEVNLGAGGTWMEQAEQWAHTYRDRLKALPDRHLLLNNQSRDALVRATRPLLGGLRSAGLDREQAVRVCRMLTWITTGFVIVESGAAKLEAHFEPADPLSPAGGRADGVTQSEIDDLFAAQIRFAVDGLRHEVESSPAGIGLEPQEGPTFS
jgi:TetR/AcrR family transcriptional regulator, tetracycline repressor protein